MTIDLLQVARYAAWAHEGQLRKYTKHHYISHPARVAARVMYTLDFNPTLVAIAFLHDTLEDCPEKVSWGAIQVLFGGEVSDGVIALTSRSKQVGSTASREARKMMDREYLSRQPKEIKFIKMIDRIDNLNEMSIEMDPNFARLYCTETLLLADVLGHPDATLTREMRALAIKIQQQAMKESK